MSFNEKQDIEFLGGPLDGYCDAFPSPLQSMVVVRTATLAPNWLARVMRRIGVGESFESFLVAVYKLQVRGEQLFYQHSSTRAATQKQLDREETWLIFEESSLPEEPIEPNKDIAPSKDMGYLD